MSEPFIAENRIFAGSYAPRSWAFCDGQLMNIGQNTALFSVIGTTYGGDGRMNFALPNLQGRVPMHPGRGPGLTTRILGQAIGQEQATLTADQMASHTHTMRGSADAGTTTNPEGQSLATFPAERRGRTPSAYQSAPADWVQMASSILGNSGGASVHSNQQPYLVLNYIISLEGIFPSRS